MNYGLYSAYLGMKARQRTLDTVANNIANASTSGFKADRLFHHSIEAAEAQILGGKPVIIQPNTQQASSPSTASNAAQTVAPGAATSTQPTAVPTVPDGIQRVFGLMSGGTTDFSVGSLRETGHPLDIALSGDSFLVVQTPRGERYTRAGSLTIDSSGQLVTQRGELVVGEGGPITVRPGIVAIGEDGSITSNGQVAGQLKIVKFADPRAALTKEGDTLFAASGKAKPQEAPGTKVSSGVVEMSNVNVVSEMAAMMQNSREFDSLQRSVTMMMSDIGRKVANEVGRI